MHPPGQGRPGIDPVDANALAAESACQAHRRQHERGVCGASRKVDRVCHFASRTDDVDDNAATARHHALQHRIGRVNVAEEFRIHGVVPRLRIEVVGRVATRGARGIDQYVDGAVIPLRLFHHVLRLVGLHEIGDDGSGDVRSAWKTRDRRIEIGPTARHHDDPRALGGERRCARIADAFACTRHNHEPVGEFEIHRNSLLSETLQREGAPSLARRRRRALHDWAPW